MDSYTPIKEKKVYIRAQKPLRKKSLKLQRPKVAPYYSAITTLSENGQNEGLTTVPKNLPKLVIMRGIPGSGKTKYCELCLSNFVRVSSDDYFIDANGLYTFVQSEMFKSHDWCYDKVITLLKAGKDVVVDNVFSKLRDFKKYFDLPFEVKCRIYHIVAHHGTTKNIPFHVVKQSELNYESHFLDMRVELILYTDGTWNTQNYGYERTLGKERLYEIDLTTKIRNGDRHSINKNFKRDSNVITNI